MAGLGRVVLEGCIGFFIVLVVAIYFLVDGERVYKWLLAFLPEVQRQKMALAGEEIATVVGHYMVGQVITSVLCAVYAFGVLSALHVRSAVLLAVLAGIFDVLPLIGFFLFAIPAVAIALTVSPSDGSASGHSLYRLSPDRKLFYRAQSLWQPPETFYVDRAGLMFGRRFGGRRSGRNSGTARYRLLSDSRAHLAATLPGAGHGPKA